MEQVIIPKDKLSNICLLIYLLYYYFIYLFF